jgi:hypothetical protein
MHASWNRRAFLTGILGVALAALLALPSLALATEGDSSHPKTIGSIPWSQDVTGTLLLTTYKSTSWGEFNYLVPLVKGKTYAFTSTTLLDDSDSYMMSITSSLPGWVDSKAVGSGVQALTFMAPKTMYYWLTVEAYSVDETFTLSAAEVGKTAYKVSGLSVPSSKKKNTAFTVSASLSSPYNSLGSPITFQIERRVGKKFKPYSSVTGKFANAASVKSTASIKIKKKGTFRIRVKLADAAHSASYTKYKTIKIK